MAVLCIRCSINIHQRNSHAGVTCQTATRPNKITGLEARCCSSTVPAWLAIDLLVACLCEAQFATRHDLYG